ncbi:MAG: TRAP transporter small permease [Phascolarctobacterium faecium]|uniref:TRAP transporter small permease n=1 Tax=Phascolarctobacterium faecium TaxID=33025 RepID=UPI00399BC00A
MKSALEVYEKFLNAITKAVGVIAGILLLLPALMVFYEVVMRGLFNAPTEWSIELSVYCVLVAGFFRDVRYLCCWQAHPCRYCFKPFISTYPLLYRIFLQLLLVFFSVPYL